MENYEGVRLIRNFLQVLESKYTKLKIYMSSNVQKTDPHEYELENEFIKGKLEVIDQVKQFIDDQFFNDK